MTIGIIGGMSPETTSAFYLKLIELSRKYRSSYPHIIIDSIPIDFIIEDQIILHNTNQQELLPFLIKSVKSLQNTDYIVVPCNTAHIFINTIRRQSTVPILSIVEESIEKIKEKGHKKIGLLATSATMKAGIYSDSEIEFLYPEKKDQNKLSGIIVKIIRNSITRDDTEELQRIAKRLRKQCDAILLACTDLQLVLTDSYLDSFDILAEALFEKIRGETYGKTAV